jgi:lipid II:glycine glycyltransferase (peptidoglycan interpeptide bridge formation enzyme)
VRYAKRKGVEVEFFYPGLAQDDSNCVNEFYSLLERASSNKDYDIPDKLYFLKAWRQYEEAYEKKQVSKDYWDTVCFALAKYKNQVISANFSQFFGNWAGSYYTANSRKFSKLRASYYLKWATILEAKKRGKTVFDMWGHVPNAKKGDPGYGFSRFKYGFNPLKKVFTGRLGLAIEPYKYNLWRFLRRFA